MAESDLVLVAHDGQAVRFALDNAALPTDLVEFCAAQRLDYARVPRGRRLSDFRLVAMDMDSTLITIECIDEIAALHGIGPQVAEITGAAMRGEIAYPESLRRRVRLLAGLPQSLLQRVYDERLRLSFGAEVLVAAFRAQGTHTLLVSGGFTFFTERLRERLGLDAAHSNVLEIRDGILTGEVIGAVFDGEAKAKAVRDTMARLGLDRSQVMAIGDGANDLAMMAEVGVSVAYRAKPIVQAQATFALNYSGLDGVLKIFN
jgi:phosphoserine phosphatase